MCIKDLFECVKGSLVIFMCLLIIKHSEAIDMISNQGNMHHCYCTHIATVPMTEDNCSLLLFKLQYDL